MFLLYVGMRSKQIQGNKNNMQAVMGLRESSWDIFYGLLSQHIKEYLPIIYTPYATYPFPHALKPSPVTASQLQISANDATLGTRCRCMTYAANRRQHVAI